MVSSACNVSIVYVSGPQGPPGAASNVLELLLTATVSGGYGVASGGTSCDVTQAPEFVGIALQGGNAGSIISVVTNGLITESAWAWTPELPVFLAAAGALTQTPPASGLSMVVGYAQSATTIFVRPQPIVQL